MTILATDLDRTLLPNGIQEYDGSMDLFRDIVEKENLKLIYVSGRNLDEINQAFTEYGISYAGYLVTEVGTKIYEKTDGGYSLDEEWISKIDAGIEGWSIEEFKKRLMDVQDLRLQEPEHQNRFKLSYYLDEKGANQKIEKVRETIKEECPGAELTYSVDETNDLGLLDIMPENANKVAALEYLREKFHASMDEVVYCGDSGNDLSALTHGYKSVLVRNAIPEVKEKVIEICEEKGIRDRLYICSGTGGLNGYYVSGILEGLLHFKVIDSINIQ